GGVQERGARVDELGGRRDPVPGLGVDGALPGGGAVDLPGGEPLSGPVGASGPVAGAFDRSGADHGYTSSALTRCRPQSVHCTAVNRPTRSSVTALVMNPE